MGSQRVMKKRYACERLGDRPVETPQLHAILEAGRLAPTAKSPQEQHIYVVQSKEALTKLDSTTPCRYGAATVAVVAFDKNNVFTYPSEKRDSRVKDASIVATHTMLAAKTGRMDSYWINFFDPEEMTEELGLPENEEVLMLLDLEYAAEGIRPLAAHSQRKKIPETVSYM